VLGDRQYTYWQTKRTPGRVASWAACIRAHLEVSGPRAEPAFSGGARRCEVCPEGQSEIVRSWEASCGS
jgi:hypothetical protein